MLWWQERNYWACCCFLFVWCCMLFTHMMATRSSPETDYSFKEVSQLPFLTFIDENILRLMKVLSQCPIP